MKTSLNRLRHSVLSPLMAIMANLLVVYVVYQVARIEFWLVNKTLFAGADWSWQYVWGMFRGSLVFDTSAIVYTNLLWMVLMLLPIGKKKLRTGTKELRMTADELRQRVCRWIFVLFNGVALVANLADSVYFPYTMRRTTWSVFSEFGNEGNIAGIVLHETLAHWYLVLLFAALVWLLWKVYRTPHVETEQLAWWKYGGAMLVELLLVVTLCVGGMRGGFATAVRPITVSNANQYVDRPIDASLILNTPFSMLRTIGVDPFVEPHYFASPDEAQQVFSPLHMPADTASMDRRNVVILIIESFGREYIGALNTSLDGGNYRGYTPFVDSLLAHSVTWEYTYCNGRKSIDAMPSILSGIPMFVEPFVLTPASLNHLSGLADRLGLKGYTTAFYHGAQNNSMGFQAFARSTGFQHYYGRTEFEADTRFGGSSEFDGTWAIWDEPFMQFYCASMTDLNEPFMTALFTATSHNPFVVPKAYQDVYPEEQLPIHKCIRYTDNALRKFFDSARRQPWFDNTVFVLLSDHTNQSCHAAYQTDIGGFCSPIIIYDPRQEREPGMRPGIAQQIDVMPTLLGMLHYDQPYIAFGCDLFNTSADSTWAVNYTAGTYQYVKHGHVLQFDGNRTTAVYALTDCLMQQNVIGRFDRQERMELELKAIVEQYMYRMNHDKLYP